MNKLVRCKLCVESGGGKDGILEHTRNKLSVQETLAYKRPVDDTAKET